MLRVEKGIPQEQLAAWSDISKGYLSLVEAGQRLPSVAALAALAEGLDLDLVDLLAFDTKKPIHALVDAVRRRDVDAVTRSATHALEVAKR